MTRTAFVTTAMMALTGLGCVGADPDDGSLEISPPAMSEQALVPNKPLLGRYLFFDTNLSSPAGQSCATCHAQDRAFADPDAAVPTSEGVIAGRFGSRNSSTAAYTAFVPTFHYDADEGLYVGGQFWDGRAATLEEQAKAPFINPIEMNNPSKAAVVDKIKAAPYALLFRITYGAGALDDVNTAYDQMANAIAEFERSRPFNRFTSKYDFYLAGQASLTAQEESGLALFDDPAKGNCAACHPSQPSDSGPPMFTDFTYDNIGIPRNPNNPFYSMPPQFNPDGAAFADRGLGKTTGDPSLDGAHKVPTLRNVGRTGPFTHAGFFTDLRSVVDFYNTRDVSPVWGPPEFPDTMNVDELGNLGLTDQEVDDIVAFLLTLSDNYVP